MPNFDNGVSSPSAASYSAPLLDFAQFSNWAADDPNEIKRKQQQQQINDQVIAENQQKLDLAKTFQAACRRLRQYCYSGVAMPRRRATSRHHRWRRWSQRQQPAIRQNGRRRRSLPQAPHHRSRQSLCRRQREFDARRRSWQCDFTRHRCIAAGEGRSDWRHRRQYCQGSQG